MKIAISGTYSTGKTTLSIALALLTGIPATRARTMREILPATFPDYSLEQCGPSQLMELGMRRFTERIQAELILNNSFISDGCPLQEWLYGSTRLITGLNPSESPKKVKEWINNHRDQWNVFRQAINAFGKVTKDYTKRNYDAIIHLPVEFPFVPEGHRPTSEHFRNESDKRLREVYKELKICPLEVYGSLSKRLKMIVEYLNLDTVISIKEAVDKLNVRKKNGDFSIEIEKRGVGKKNLFDAA